MKVFVIVLQVLVFLGIQLNAQEPTLPTVEEFITSSPERAYQILNTPTGGHQIHTYVRAAVASGRTDLVMACFRNPSSWNFTLSAIAELPESPQRDEWTILMLKSPSSLWPEEAIHDGSGLIPKDVMDEPFVSLVRRLLPGHPTSGEAVFTTEKRLKLAADLEAALAKNRSSQPTQSSPPGDAVVEQSSGTTSSPTSTPQTPTRQPKAATSWLMWVGILGAMIGLLYWLIKRRK